MHDPLPSLHSLPHGSRRRFGPHLRWLIPLLLVAGVGLWGYLPTPTGPAAGTVLYGTAIRSTTQPTLRVATYNIHSGRNTAGDLNLAKTAAVLKGFDLVALNEVRGKGILGEHDQARLLGEKLNMQWLFAPTENQWWHESFGNGVLSAVSAIDWRRVPLAGSFGRGKRNLVCVRVTLQGKVVNVLITHIDRGNDHKRQLRAVLEEFVNVSEPAVLMGDLNGDASDPYVMPILQARGVKDAVGSRMGARAPADRIDWIFTRGLETVSAGVEKNDASDHPMVWAELKLP
ncbi:MAG TPA: endonuclease/exonuclease/phosphatase family protein [Tepidisphaeraceae bacterium]|nr:endonuclease/exonuclease/phosphatase family protein [Tepidisphaeraceae bacterium]